MKVTAFIIILFTQHTLSQDLITKINDKSEFEKLSGLPLSDKYGQVSSIKLVYDLKDATLYFINSKHYKYHYEFCNDVLDYDFSTEFFNKVNYSNVPERRFLLANINYFKALDIYGLELSHVDLMSIEQIIFLYQIVSKSTFIENNLRFLLNSSRLQSEKNKLKATIPLLEPSEVYRNQNYQAISKFSGYGILKYIDDLNTVKDELTPEDIIILKNTPEFLPKVSGIIVTEFQTPLSHLTILGLNRKIPICAYRNAFLDSTLKSLDNMKVFYSVQSDSFKIEAVEYFSDSEKKFKKVKIQYDFSIQSIIDISEVNRKSYKYAGNKAANFGELVKLSKKADFKTPESAFVIPFYFYNQHINQSNAQILIHNLISTDSIISNPKLLKKALKEIRNEIRNTQLDTNLLNSVIAKIKSYGNYTRMRFRSSTNAEDAKGFSGAGLYTSKTGIIDSRQKPIDIAIKEVWANLWSFEAFTEREYFQINQQDVNMAILVHRSFPDEGVNGVALTKNIYNNENHGFVVNAQIGDESVVKPKSGNISDQFICYPKNPDIAYKEKIVVDIITISNLTENKLVMSDSEIQHLANQLELIKKHYYDFTKTSKTYLEFGLDIEFKLDGMNRDLYIKQVRIYND